MLKQRTTMKLYILSTILMFHFTSLAAFADVPEPLRNDPLAETQVIRKGGHELIGIRANESITIEVSKYFDERISPPNILKVLEYQGPNVDSFFNRYNMTTADVNGSGVQEIVAAWIISGEVEIVALRADPIYLGAEILGDTNAVWEDIAQVFKSDPTPYDGDAWLRTPPLLASGDFNGDGTDDFVLAYMAEHNGDIVINLSLFVVGDSLQAISELASARKQSMLIDQPQVLRPSGRPLHVFDITAADFNGDGIDEILLVGRESSESGWNIFASIYSFDGTNELKRNLHEYIFAMPDFDPDVLFEIQNISVVSGHLNDSEAQQAVAGFNLFNTHNIYASYMLGLSFNESLTELAVSVEPFRRARVSNNYEGAYWDNVIRTGDINGDGLFEIVSYAGYRQYKSYNIYKLNDELQFVEYALDLSIPRSHNYPNSPVFAVGNVIMDPERKRNTSELANGQSLYAFEIGDDGQYQGVDLAASPGLQHYGCWFPGGNYPYDCSSPLVTAELDGDIRIGVPRRFRVSNILHPMIILNAPPTHFDVLDGRKYDVSLSYNENVSKFKAVYKETSIETEALQTTFTRDWGVSGTLSAGGSFLGASVSAHLTTKYGERFRKDETASKTVTVRSVVEASLDDRIYASTINYDIWEYPVLSEGVEKGHILVVDPAVVDHEWIPGRSRSADNYVSNHEVGNLLSYRSTPGFGDYGPVDLIIGTNYELSPDIGSTRWELNIEKFTLSNVTKEKDFYMEMGASAGKWGVKLELGGHYGSNQISTQTTSVTEGLEIEIWLDALSREVGEANYKVQPYVYWTHDGALVIDYAVELPLPAVGHADTFWSLYYAKEKADPAFILPWRYHTEKGNTFTDPARRFQTRDITFFPNDPTAGETITIFARIHNFSKLPTDRVVCVRFYVGDPDDGGALITGVGGVTQTCTHTVMEPRSTRMVTMDWIVPGEIGSYPRIFAVIDPEHTIAAIHTNNKKGWSVLGKPADTGLEDGTETGMPMVFALKQNYPNPFNPATTIRFELPTDTQVKLEVFDLLGRRVAVLADDMFAAGQHSVYFDAAHMTSGLYVYRLLTPHFMETRKMMLVK